MYKYLVSILFLFSVLASETNAEMVTVTFDAAAFPSIVESGTTNKGHGFIFINGNTSAFDLSAIGISKMTADNTSSGSGKDLGVLFHTDSLTAGSGNAAYYDQSADTDLQRNSGWSAGNIKSANLGNVLIIQENELSSTQNGVRDDRLVSGADGNNVADYQRVGSSSRVIADDEGNRPTGTVRFEFGKAVNGIGFDIVDIDGSTEGQGTFQLLDSGMNVIANSTFSFNEIATSLRAGDGIQFANRSANRYGGSNASAWNLLTASELSGAKAGLNISEFFGIQFNMNGSVGIDNLTFSPVGIVPEPSTVTIWGVLAAVGLWRVRRRSKKPAKV